MCSTSPYSADFDGNEMNMQYIMILFCIQLIKLAGANDIKHLHSRRYLELGTPSCFLGATDASGLFPLGFRQQQQGGTWITQYAQTSRIAVRSERSATHTLAWRWRCWFSGYPEGWENGSKSSTLKKTHSKKRHSSTYNDFRLYRSTSWGDYPGKRQRQPYLSCHYPCERPCILRG